MFAHMDLLLPLCDCVCLRRAFIAVAVFCAATLLPKEDLFRFACTRLLLFTVRVQILYEKYANIVNGIR